MIKLDDLGITGEIKILSYSPGEKEKWEKIEDDIYIFMDQLYTVENDVERVIKKTQSLIDKVKVNYSGDDLKKYDHHCNLAGKRFIKSIEESKND